MFGQRCDADTVVTEELSPKPGVLTERLLAWDQLEAKHHCSGLLFINISGQEIVEFCSLRFRLQTVVHAKKRSAHPWQVHRSAGRTGNK